MPSRLVYFLVISAWTPVRQKGHGKPHEAYDITENLVRDKRCKIQFSATAGCSQELDNWVLRAAARMTDSCPSISFECHEEGVRNDIERYDRWLHVQTFLLVVRSFLPLACVSDFRRKWRKKSFTNSYSIDEIEITCYQRAHQRVRKQEAIIN